MFDGKDLKDICSLYEGGNSSITIAKQYNCSYPTITRLLKQYNVEIRQPTLRKRTHQLIDENYFEIIDTEEKAYILGFFYADAYHNTDNFQINLTLNNKDLEILEKISHILYDKTKLYHHKNNCSSLVIYSKKMSTDLENQGCMQAKTFKITFPNLHKDLQQHFIRGYFDGDGCLWVNDKRGRVSIASTQSVCMSIKNILEKELSINCSVNKPKNKNIFYLYINGNRQIKIFLEWMYKGATIFLQRKWLKQLQFQKIFDSLDRKKSNNYNKRLEHNHV